MVVTAGGHSYVGDVAGLEVNFANGDCHGGGSTTSASYVMRISDFSLGGPLGGAVLFWSSQNGPELYPFPIPSRASLSIGGCPIGCQFNLGDAGLFTVPVPEPGTMVLLGSGLIGIAAKAHRRRRSRSITRLPRRPEVAPFT